jgi:hypothetical protein
MRFWVLSHSSTPGPPFAKEMLQNVPVQRLKVATPKTGLPRGRLVTHHRELNITFKPRYKDNRTENMMNYGKENS